MGKQPYRVLQIVTSMDRGGTETMIMNHYRAIDKEKIQFDFLVHRSHRGAYDDEIEQLGGHIYRAFPIRPWNYPKYFKFLNKFFKKHHSDFIAVHSHIHENSGFPFKYANKYGIKHCIVHSHIADLGIDYKYPFRLFGKIFVKKYATEKFACGKDAGIFLYGKHNDFIVFNNAIDSEKFKYNTDTRTQIRNKLGLENKFVIGHVGRFGAQKNHTFLIDVFKEILSHEKNSVLILVGDGPLRFAMEDKAKKLQINNNVLFLGLRSDIPELLQAFDVLLFPSLYEGLPVSIIEAQAAGLPCILSDTIDNKTAITPNVKFVSLSAGIQTWVKTLLSFKNFVRQDTSEYIIKANYDIHNNAKWLEEFYLANKHD